MHRRWHRDDITTCCHKLKIEKYALKNAPRMSMFILGVFSWHQRPACSLLAACMQGVDAGVQGVDPGMQGVDAGNVHVYFNGGGYSWSVMQAACRASTPRKYAENWTCNLHMQAACRLHAACMQPACISSVALALQQQIRKNKVILCRTHIGLIPLIHS